MYSKFSEFWRVAFCGSVREKSGFDPVLRFSCFLIRVETLSIVGQICSRASSYEPGFRGLALPQPRSVHMRGQAGSVSEISPYTSASMCSYDRAGWLGSRDLGFFNRDLGKRAGNFSIWLFIPVTGMKAGWILAQMASPCIACCIFRIIIIPVNCSDTALRVAKAMIGAKVIIFVFRMSAFLSLCAGTRPQDHWPSAHLGNRAEISPMNPRRNWSH